MLLAFSILSNPNGTFIVKMESKIILFFGLKIFNENFKYILDEIWPQKINEIIEKNLHKHLQLDSIFRILQ